MVGSAMLARHIDRLLADFVRSAIVAIGLVVVVLASLQLAGIPTASFLAVLGTAGLAIGLALKDSLAQLASGVQLMVLRPFRAGDQVTVAGQEGRVQAVRLFQTVLLSPDNRLITLPNTLIVNQAIVNASRCDKRRIDVSLMLSIDTPLPRVVEAIGPVLERAPLLSEPAASVMASDLSDKGVQLVVQAWAAREDLVLARSTLIEALQRALAEAGVRPLGPPAPPLPSPS
jgi:small-conductance mechanosensitive channel